MLLSQMNLASSKSKGLQAIEKMEENEGLLVS
jgi:hypothetical protein